MTLTLNVKEALNAALSLFQQKVTDITSDLTKDIQRMDDQLAQLANHPTSLTVVNNDVDVIADSHWLA